MLAGAQDQSDFTVDVIEFRGLNRVSDQLVRSQLEQEIAEPYSPKAVARDILRLYEMGMFSTIKVDREERGGQNIVVYIFEEEKVIDEIRLIGNKKQKDRQIRSVLNWKEADSFYPEAYEDERDALLTHYRSKGFLKATVDIQVEDVGPARVRVTYVIDEGRKAKIRSIKFEDNVSISDRKLHRITRTGSGILFIGGRFNDEKFETDIRKIVDKYGEVGRLEASVARTEFDYAKNGKKLDITLYIQEGPEYTVSTLDVADNYVFTDQEIRNNISVGVGQIHNKTAVGEDAVGIRNIYRDNGYVRANVAEVVTLNKEDHTTNIIHQVREGELKYIREIKFTGNSVTKDEVIRRWVLLSRGDRYDGSLHRTSENRINGSQYFEVIRPSVVDVENSDRFIDLLYDVDEGKTGNFNFGAGLNTDEGIGGFGELRLNNFDITNWPSFSGGGQQFLARFNIGDVRTSYNLSFTDPEIFGYPFSFGVDIFDDEYKSTGGSDFTQHSQGGQIRLGKVLSNHITLRTALRYDDVEITRLATFVDPSLRGLEDPGSTISNTWGITRNTANHFRDPTAGSFHDLSVEFAGLGGDNEFSKYEHESVFYFSLKGIKKWSLSLRTREGYSLPHGDTDLVPLSSRFYAGGGTTVRGYDNRDIGPKAFTFQNQNGRIIIDEQAIGGEFRLLQSVEAKYKYNDTVRVYTFFDSGGVWMEFDDFDLSDMRYSVGVGVGLQMPFLGPLRIDYGIPLNADSDQGNGRLHLQTSLRF